ncbi:hypothetical protein Ahy_A07g033110 [Arachis hypogaea]|uniref:RNase H type-1 domain-containing protein n=1 Tax=Arachis hypogaea TaxID=3818 RepID=A0A445C885_ARAHY|nr:hypothetical protein Ahy_A07g033110 [Arachis hypogaea]
MSNEEPQAYMGDFNDILSQDEKMYQNVTLKAAPAITSDHCALILETQPRGRIKKEFKFEAFWPDHEKCKEVIRNCWKQEEGAQEEEIYQLIHILNIYTEASGQTINTEKFGLIFGSQELFPENIAELIRRTPISLINKRDHFVWPDRLDGQYSVKSGYHSAKVEKDTKKEINLSKASTSQNLREVWKTIWRLPVPQKVKIFLWKAVHIILSVNVNLYQRRCAVKPSCSICQVENETVEHALLLCPWTRAVWFGSSLQIAPTTNNVTSFEKWMMDTVRKIKSGTGKEQDRILCNLGSVCWCIWKARNQHIYQQIKINPKQVIINAEQLATEYHNTTRGSSTDNIPRQDRSGERKRITWRPPPQNKLKVNTGATFHRESGIASTAVVVRDWQGKIITGTTTRFTTTSAIAAEAQAYREALILIKNLQIGNCIIESDCLPLARTPIADADAIIRDILQLLDEAPDVGATWTPREGNKVAHQLAAMAAENELRRQWIFDPPNQIRNTIRTEAGFAILQHNQRMHKQVKRVSGPINHQGHQLENGLPERAETESQDKQQAEEGMQLRSTAVLRPTSDNSNHRFHSWRRARRGSTDGPTAWQSSSRQRISGAVNANNEGSPSRRCHHPGRQHLGSATGSGNGEPMMNPGGFSTTTTWINDCGRL